MNKPTLIIVCGRPGSGKSTLARKLSGIVRCPLISRDELKEGYVNAAGKRHSAISGEENKSIKECYFGIINMLLDNKITCIAESAFQEGVWLPEYQKIRDNAIVKMVVCTTDRVTANRRFLERKRDDPLREYFHGDSVISGENDEYEYNPPGLPVPVLAADTTNGYKPGLEEIAVFAGGNINEL